MSHELEMVSFKKIQIHVLIFNQSAIGGYFGIINSFTLVIIPSLVDFLLKICSYLIN